MKRFIMVFLCWFSATAGFGPVLSDDWYPQNSSVLNRLIADNLTYAHKNFPVAVGPDSIRALIVPHAGYKYSGQCAAATVGTLLVDGSKNGYIDRVILLAPSHHQLFAGVAMPDFARYKTVLGEIPIDRASIKKLAKKGLFKVLKDPFLHEHAIEIELPFLQQTIKNFTLIPLIVGTVGEHDIEQIASVLAQIITDKTLIVVSSDFVHHGQGYGYEKFGHDILDQVRQIDSRAVQAIVAQSRDDFDRVIAQTGATICGCDPIRILLALLKAGVLGTLESRLTCYYVSPQVEASRDNLLKPVADQDSRTSVSYLGLIFTTEKLASKPLIDRLTGYEKRVLLALARRSIENQFAEPGKELSEEFLYPLASQGLSLPAGAFVTLKTKNGDLRGCIGRIETTDPLYKTVLRVARDAAFHDSRFLPVTARELADLEISISVLEPPVSIKNWRDIVIGKHGVILTHGSSSAVFLPQVAPEQGWDLPTMLSQLSLKAGLPADSWRDKTARFKVFEGCEIAE